MRMPWQRRGAGGAAPIERSAAESSPRAWRSLPPLATSARGKPPLTAGTDLADVIAKRLRSTRDRPRLLHRTGLPEAAAAGTVRGIAMAVPQPSRALGARRPARASAEEDTETVHEAVPDASSGTPPSPHVIARRRKTGSLTVVDPGLVALVQPPLEPRMTTQVEDADGETDVDDADTPARVAEHHGLQRTVVRRRMGTGATRPIGLQAPISLEPAEPQNEKRMSEKGSSEVPEASQSRQQPPRAVAAAVGRLHRADVSDVHIDRGEEADRLASAVNARAVTRGEEVFIPADQGPLDSGRGAGLLAHELTHVVQQRRLGGSVPLEHSPRGRRLEAEASMTERHVRGDLAAPAPPPAASESAAAAPVPQAPAPSTREEDEAAAATVREIQDELVASGTAIRMPDGSLVFPGSGAHLREQRPSPAQAVVAIQRAPDQPADAEEPAAEAVEHHWFRARPDSGHTPPPEVHFPPAPAPVVPAPASSQVAAQAASPGAPAATAPAAASSDADATPTGSAPAAAPSPADAAPPADEAPPLDIDELARRVYGQVRTQLRSELLIDRERAGLLTDFR